MSRCNWLYHAALRGCLIAVLSAIPLGLLAQENDPQQPAQTRNPEQTAPTPAQPRPPLTVTTRPAGIEPEKTVEANWSQPNCRQPQSHDEADLCQQRRISKATE